MLIRIAPSISKTTSKPFERTSYNEIQWSPQDDMEDPRRSWTGPVKITILDTGIDLDHPNFSQRGKRRSKVTAKQLSEKMQRERIIGSKNFTRGPEDDVTDDVGHGTHIAVLIMAIAPRAELYIAKVSSTQNSRSKEESGRMVKRGIKRSHIQYKM